MIAPGEFLKSHQAQGKRGGVDVRVKLFSAQPHTPQPPLELLCLPFPSNPQEAHRIMKKNHLIPNVNKPSPKRFLFAKFLLIVYEFDGLGPKL